MSPEGALTRLTAPSSVSRPRKKGGAIHLPPRGGKGKKDMCPLLDLVPGLLNGGTRVSGGFSADIIHHAGPEGASADLAGHEV